MSLAELSNLLWRQRQLLDLLLFKMTVEQQLLAGRQIRWLARATDEVEAVLAEMREVELLRAVVLDDLAAAHGLEANPSLRAVAAAVPEPWQGIFEEHRQAFLALTDEVQSVARSNRELLNREQTANRDLLVELTGDERVSIDDVSYGNARRPMSAVVLDEAL